MGIARASVDFKVYVRSAATSSKLFEADPLGEAGRIERKPIQLTKSEGQKSWRGFAPQAVMRHSDLKLTMNTCTDKRLLDVSGVVELLPELPIVLGREDAARIVTTNVTLATVQTGQKRSQTDHFDDSQDEAEKREKPKESLGFSQWAIQDSNL